MSQSVPAGRRTQQSHYRGLDGLRGLAVAMVVLYHGGVSWAQGGFLGVEAFFVLSGFLITSLLVGEWGRSRRSRSARSGLVVPGGCSRRCSARLGDRDLLRRRRSVDRPFPG